MRLQVHRISYLLLAISMVACAAPVSGNRQHARDLYDRGEHRAAEAAIDRELESAPEDPELWRLKINAAIRAGDAARGVELYMRWHRLRRHYDDAALRSMAESVLFSALADPEAEVRVRAIEAVDRSGLGSLEDLDRMIAEALDDGDARVAAAAVWSSSHGRSLARARELAAHEDARVRARIVAALARKKQDRDRVRAGLLDPAPEVRRAAVKALSRRPNADERGRLLVVARDDPDGAVRAAALNALRSARGDEIVAAARGALEDEHLGVRLAGLAILAADPERHGASLRELAGSSDIFVALRASLAVTKNGGEAPVQTVELALAHGLWTVRVAGLNAVAEILEGKTALSMIEARTSDARPEVRLAAARVLARLGQRGRAHTILAAELAAPRAETRLEAAMDLLRLDDESGRAALEELATNPDPKTRQQAIAAHQFTDNPTLPLIQALGDEAPDVRMTAATVLLGLL